MKESLNPLIVKYFIVLFLISLFLMVKLLWPFISIILLASVTATFIYPAYKRLSFKIKSSLSALIICFIIFISVSFIVIIFVGVLSNEAYNLYLAAKNTVFQKEIITLISDDKFHKLNLFLSKFNITISKESIIAPFTELGKFLGSSLVNQARLIASNVLNLTINFFMYLIILFFLLIDGKKIINALILLSPLPEEEDKIILSKFRDMSGAILIVNGISGIFQGIVGGIFFQLASLPSPFLWGFVMGLLAFLPIVGIGAVFIPLSLFYILKGKISLSIFTILFYLISSLFTEYVFKPKIVGGKVQMHPLMVFLGIIGGLKLFGFFGIVYGPLILTFFFTLSDMYYKKYQKIVE